MTSFFSKQLGRRILVINYYLLFLNIYPSLENYFGVMMSVLFLFISPLSFKLSSVIKAYHDDNPDEREHRLINQAHRIAYGILVPTIIVVLIIEKTQNPSALAVLSNVLVIDDLTNLWPFAIFASTLPAAIMMWLEPNPVQDEIFLREEMA